MSDDRLREALRQVVAGDLLGSDIAALAAAARAYADGTDIWWCEEHEQKGRWSDKCMGSYWKIQGAQVSQPCRMVLKRISSRMEEQ